MARNTTPSPTAAPTGDPMTAKSTATVVAAKLATRAASKSVSSEAVRTPSTDKPHKRKHLCPVSHRCGACQLLDIPYPTQLEDKQTSVSEVLKDFLTETTVVYPILGMDNPFYYRDKVTSPYAPGRKIAVTKKGSKKHHSRLDHEVVYGMYARGSHKLVPTESCLIENETGKQIVLSVKRLMERYGVAPYDEDSNTGFMRHCVVRVGHASGEVLVTLITNGHEFKGAKGFVRALIKDNPSITTVVQNINTRQTNVILGEEEHTLYGPGFILDDLCGLRLRISSRSFYQVNSTQTEVLYRRAIQMAALTGSETLLDAYCGTGSIGLVAARGLKDTPGARAAHVIGVDDEAAAIDDARQNARHNGIDNAEFTVDDAGAFMERLASEGLAVDVLLMDPPRSGASRNFLDSACRLSPARIVYISCNPSTQARDLRVLATHRYRLEKLQAVDMFPHTPHVETVVLMSRKSK